MSPPREIKCTAVKALLDGSPVDKPILLDVRTFEERAFCALPGSLHVPLGELPERLDELVELDPEQERLFVVYCHHGVRSLTGAALLEASGFAATSMRGGIEAWAREVDPRVPTY